MVFGTSNIHEDYSIRKVYIKNCVAEDQDAIQPICPKT